LGGGGGGSSNHKIGEIACLFCFFFSKTEVGGVQAKHLYILNTLNIYT